MSPIVYRMMEVLSALVETLPVGTNLGLLHVLWAVTSGRLLAHRGGIIPALDASGLSIEAVRRGWRALAHGEWDCAHLVRELQQRIIREQQWQPHEHGGFFPVVLDLTAFYRPRLRNCLTHHYSTIWQRVLPAIPFGLLVRVGSIAGVRTPIPVAIVRSAVDANDESDLMRRSLKEAAAQLGPKEVLVADRGFSVAMLQECGVQRFVVRCAKNFAPHRVELPAYRGSGRRPVRGVKVCPLPRSYKGKRTEATLRDSIETWQEPHGKVRALVWEHLTTKDAAKDAPPFRVVAIYDPQYKEPLLLATTLSVSALDLRKIYVDRWAVEMVPQVAKQMLGAQRQFVFAPEACQRLPEIALVAAFTLLYTAPTMPACPTGFWDRTPRPTSGRLRRVLASTPFPKDWPLPPQIRKKNSVTDHLLKGTAAHRRQPGEIAPPKTPSKSKSVAKNTRT